MAAKKITKKQMKQDRFISSIFEAYSYARNHQNQLLIVGIVVVVIIVGVFGFISYQKSKKQEAIDMLGLALFAYRQSDFTASRDTLVSLVEKYPDTPSGKIGFYYLGHLRMMLTEYEDAISNLERFLSDPVEDDDLIAAGTRMLAGCYEEKGEFEEAGEMYVSIIEKYPDFFDAEQVLLDAARCYKEAKNFEKTKELYSEFLDKYDESFKKEEIKLALTELETRKDFEYYPEPSSVIKPQAEPTPMDPQQRQLMPGQQGGGIQLQPGDVQVITGQGAPQEGMPAVTPTGEAIPPPPPGGERVPDPKSVPSPDSPGDLVPEAAPPGMTPPPVEEASPGETPPSDKPESEVNETPPSDAGE